MTSTNGQAGGLEDQLRRMILNNGQESSTVRAERPTVRLPPAAPHQAGEQNRSTKQRQNAPAHDAAQGRGAFAAGPLGSRTAGPQSAASGKGQWRPDQHQHRMQPQTQMVTPNGSVVNPRLMAHGRDQHRQQSQYRPPPPPQIDPNAYQRGGQVAGYYQRSQPPPRQLFDPNSMRGPPSNYQAEQHMRQAQYLEHVASVEIAKLSMSPGERLEKEAFRSRLEQVVQEVCATDPDRLPKVALESFGSFKSGFANKGSDMDLVIVLPDGSPCPADFGLMEDDLPRALEKRLLELGYGARLLTRTRVPIIKICEIPPASFLDKLREERSKWDLLDHEQKYPHLHPELGEDEKDVGEVAETTEAKPDANVVIPSIVTKERGTSKTNANGAAKQGQQPQYIEGDAPITTDTGTKAKPDAGAVASPITTEKHSTPQTNVNHTGEEIQQPNSTKDGALDSNGAAIPSVQSAISGPIQQARPKRDNRPFTRERKAGPLDFPNEGVGIASDINFFNPLGLHNTQLLRCYSLCDPRVQDMVLFVKSWAKRRKINSSYSGTLSSYGYVLMVLHYLVNIVRPPVLPNLQSPWRPNGQSTATGARRVECDGWVVDFWREEDEILRAAKAGQMSSNREPLGSLLEGFFRYYSSMGGGPTFHWMQNVLSLRSPGGILSKDQKGWVKAVTQEGLGKKVQHRYLFCIEDPFELDHNVARTVTHYGIVAIRDEFRRARRILTAIGFGQGHDEDGDLLDEMIEKEVAAPAADVDGSAQMGANTNAAQSLARPEAGSSTARNTATQKQPRPANGGANARPLPSRAPNVTDQDAFPTLGGAKPAKPPARSPASKGSEKGQTGEISGDRARAYLAELKRKKAEADAETTATGAAEAVLGGE
ncbi:hypothetical protein LTR01_007211 [Friedmanniomyces endolithicus]|nr:hypothetical protein LTR01_007211 [Friedmanniomyces endolithicus]